MLALFLLNLSHQAGHFSSSVTITPSGFDDEMAGLQQTPHALKITQGVTGKNRGWDAEPTFQVRSFLSPASVL